MKDTIHRYIRNYHTCKQAKAPRNQYNGILKSLPIPTYPWTNVTSDFITKLPLNNDYNAILIIIDQLTKKKHYILYTTNENNTIVEAIAFLLLNNVWKLYGFSLLFTLNKGPQFILGV